MRSRLATVAVLAAAALSCGPQAPSSARAAAVVAPLPVYCGEVDCSWLLADGACQRLATWLSLPGQFTDVRMSAPAVGPNVLRSGLDTFIVSLQPDATTFDWLSTTPVAFVAATAVQDSNVYVYAPPATSDQSLVAWSSRPLTQVLFCLPAQALSVSVTGSGAFTRTWGWQIDKSAPASTVTTAPGATVDVSYAVTVAAAPADAAFAASGTITVQNPSSLTATGVTIDASLGGVTFVPDCGAFTGSLAPGATLDCTWTAPAAAAVDADAVVTVSYAGGTAAAARPGPSAAALATQGLTSVVATAPISFSPTELDPCVVVTDDRAGALGTVCAANAPAVFRYTLPVGPYASCDPSGAGYAFSNTASFAAPSGATGSSTWTVQVLVPCSGGCTLTQGYWKTHGAAGPAPYDSRWTNLGPLGEDTPFFLSGQTWLEVFRTPVQGSAYFALAHQYMAAKLDVLAGASPAALGDALAVAEAFFAANGPATRLTPAQRSDVLALADLLDRFDSGTIGPGHCDGAGPL